MVRGTTTGGPPVLGFRWAGSQWVDDNDANTGLPVLSDTFRFATPVIGTIQVLLRESGGVSTTLQTPYYYASSEFYATASSSTCTYSWDTTTADNGTWYLDVEAVGSSTVIDSSDAAFTVANFSAANLAFTPINNISDYDFNANFIEVYLIDETKDAEFSVENLVGTAASFKVRIHNSFDDGRVYDLRTSADGSGYVFNDSLTYGSTASNGVQKIWNDDEYLHSASDTLTALETRYYQARYRSPLRHSKLLAWPSWFNELIGETTVIGDIQFSIFSISSYASLSSYMLEYLPDLLASSNVDYEISFTAFTDSSLTLNVGQIEGDTNSSSTTAINLTTTPTTYHISVNPTSNFSRPYFSASKTDGSAILYIQNIEIKSRDFFNKKIRLFKESGSPLDVLIDDANATHRYIREGQNLLVTSEVYDKEGVLDYALITSHIDLNSDANISRTRRIDFDNQPEEIIPISVIVAGALDLTDSSQTKNFIVKITLFDENGFSVASQSDYIKLRQMPDNVAEIDMRSKSKIVEIAL